MKFDVVIPNYNGFELIEKNLPVLLSNVEKYNVGEIIISDDFSKLDNYSRLESFIKRIDKTSPAKVVLLRNKKNLGFSSNVNHAVAKGNSEFVLLLNTDILVEKNFLDAAILDLETNKNLFGVGLMDKSIEGSDVVLRGRGLAKWSRGFLIHSKGDIDKKDTFWISGGSSLMRRDLFEKLGGFDSLFNPFYWEDIDLSYRAKKAGYELMFEPESSLEHYHSKGAIKKHYKSGQIKKIAYRNQLIFVWKNITDPFLLASHLFWLPYHILRAFFSFDTAFISGFLAALMALPAIISKRKLQKRFYVKSDRELLYK